MRNLDVKSMHQFNGCPDLHDRYGTAPVHETVVSDFHVSGRQAMLEKSTHEIQCCELHVTGSPAAFMVMANLRERYHFPTTNGIAVSI